jgi:peptidyl-prolyl cis-trans isomerase SurA
MTLGQLRDREVNRRINISEGEVDNYLAAAAARAENPEYTLAHIIVRLPEQVDADKIARLRSKAEEALQKLQRGEDFAKIAATYSDAPDALSGGMLGTRPADRLPTLYADALKTLSPGQISGILRSSAGFHIVKLIEKRGGKVALPSQRQTHARHILIKVGDAVSNSEAKQKIDAIKARIDAGGSFAEEAKLHSNDLSAPKGGDLGWLSQGSTVPPFEKAMDALPLNKVSDPVRTAFGWHLIEVLERKQDEGSEERLRQNARQVLLERKADETMQDWLRQLRDRAYVEYRLEER